MPNPNIHPVPDLESVNPMETPLRIVHACNFYYNRHGEKFDIMDMKIHHGLIENGHYVYPFPIHDISRQTHWTNSKNFGKKQANDSLIQTCRAIQPDLLLLGHSQTISRKTLETIRKNHPSIKIAQWWCDWLYNQTQNQFMYDRLDLLDAFFATTGGDHLAVFNRCGCRTAFFPNPVHPGIEKYRSFESTEHDYDLIFIGTAHDDPDRRNILHEMQQRLGGRFRIGIFGSLGQPAIYGYEKERILARSKAALNLTRLPEPMKWYSSDRIASLMGNGILTCTHACADLHEIYGSDSMIYYRDINDLIGQLEDVLSSDNWRAIAQKGWEVSHARFNTKKVALTMIQHILKPQEN